MEKVSLWIRGAKVWNAYEKKFEEADVAVEKGRFCYIDRERRTFLDAERILDAAGMYLLPGLIDIHMHIESTMMTPENLAWALAGNGVTTIVSEPHEMANVKGMRGILEMIQAGKHVPVDIFYGIPSCVPSTSDELETAGGKIGFAEMKALLEYPEVACVGEVMNYRGVLEEPELDICRFLSYVRKERPGLPIEGHCPELVGRELAAYLGLGIDSDHTEHSLEEVRQRIENGMFLEIQEKMLRQEILDYLISHKLYEHCAFVTDDTMADTLMEQGQLNHVAAKAVEMGFPLEEAVYCATYTPARRMRFFDRGTVAPGKIADFQLVERPETFRPVHVFKNGEEIWHPGVKPMIHGYAFPEDFYTSVRVPEVSPEFFRVPAPKGASFVWVRVMEVARGGTHTHEKVVKMPVQNGFVDWQGSGCLLAAVLERHGIDGSRAFGFLTGDCHKKGTIATTYLHDHHNLLVAGDSPEDMAWAVGRIRRQQGGYLAVRKKAVLAELALPVCGILSERPAEETGAALKHVRFVMRELGYEHENPIMSFACLGLPVSPELKLTNRGLIETRARKKVSLIIKEGERL